MTNCPVGYTCPLIDEALNLHEQLASQVENFISGDFRNLVDVIERIKEIVEDDQKFKDVMEEIRSANEQLRDWGHAEEEIGKDTLNEQARLEAELGDTQQALNEANEELDIARAEIRDLEEKIRELENA